METNNDPEQFEPGLEWMNDADEISRRLTPDAKLFAQMYPQRYVKLQETNQWMLLNDPLFYIAEIEKYLESLPTFIEEAQRGPESAKLRKLEVIKGSITYTLIPSTPIHPIIRAYINEHERELNDYLLQVLSLKQQLTDKAVSPPPVNVLSARERALIHCYKDLPSVKKGEPMYNDYIDFATPKKRIAYCNDSKRKADLLIKSIERILPSLTDLEKKQAESEIRTIEAKFSS
ncbi:hypothetical protein [Spirosoma luteum]|uniref:hypothetical protein n=1 Tax=Spirosoma luteum TaxID=431553 RepID=UPI00036F1C80|nr:hypothetical protein [Spirosoma luteum]